MTLITYSIIFDLDGVLLDSESDMSWMKKALEDTLLSFNIEPSIENLEMLDHKNISKFPYVAKTFGINAKQLWKNRNSFYTKRKIEAIESNQIRPFEDVSALEPMKHICELGILSNSPQEVVDVFLNHYHYENMFSVAIGRTDKYEDIFKLKPHPLLWQKMKPFE